MEIVKNAIRCVDCSKILEKPVSIGCGKCVCRKHVEHLMDQMYACKSCGDEHRITRDNSQVVEPLEALIKANIEKLNLGEVYTEAYTNCAELDRVLDDAEELFNDPEYYINESIGKLKNEIEVMREIYKIQIDNMAHELTADLDAYKHECMSNLDQAQCRDRINHMKEYLTLMRNELAECQAKLNDFNTNEREWQVVKHNCQRHSYVLKSNSDDLRSVLLLDKYNRYTACVRSFKKIRLNYQTSNNSSIAESQDFYQETWD